MSGTKCGTGGDAWPHSRGSADGSGQLAPVAVREIAVAWQRLQHHQHRPPPDIVVALPVRPDHCEPFRERLFIVARRRQKTAAQAVNSGLETARTSDFAMACNAARRQVSIAVIRSAVA